MRVSTFTRGYTPRRQPVSEHTPRRRLTPTGVAAVAVVVAAGLLVGGAVVGRRSTGVLIAFDAGAFALMLAALRLWTRPARPFAPPDVRDSATARSDMASMVAHELRNPLMAVKGLASTGARLYDTMSDDERREFFASIDAEATRLKEIIDGTATALRIDAGEVDYLVRPEPLQGIVEEAVLRARSREHPLVVEAQPGLVVRCDRSRIMDVLEQLLDNAIKFSPPQEPVEVRSFANGDGLAVVEVIDRGPGIPDEDAGHLFDKFRHVRPAGYEHVQGAGLGLFISRAHVEAHGGQLRLERADQAQTIASFTLPLEAT